MFEKLVETKSRMEEMRRALNEEFKAKIADVFNDFFAANPDVYAFAWSQYTPYFNDGDECVFSLNEIYAYKDHPAVREAVAEGSRELVWGELEGTEDEVVWNTWSGNSKNTAVEDFIRELTQFEDEFQYAFGDHVMVIVTRDGIDVEEFDHD